MSNEQRRERFEQAVIDRLKEGGFLEVEIRTECMVREGDGYYDDGVNACWHYWNAALDSVVIELPAPRPFVSREQTLAECRAAIEAAGVQVKP